MQTVKGGTIAEAGGWVFQPIFRGSTLSPHYPLIMNLDSSVYQRKMQRERKTQSDWKIKVHMQDMNGFMGYFRSDFDLQKLYEIKEDYVSPVYNSKIQNKSKQ